MKIFRHEFVVDCPVEKAWDFFTDTNHIDSIGPSDFKEKLVTASSNRLIAGTDVWISTNLFVRKIWHSMVVWSEPYEYVDEVKEAFLK